MATIDPNKQIDLTLVNDGLKNCPPLSHDLTLASLYKQAGAAAIAEFPKNQLTLEKIATHVAKKYYPGFKVETLKFEITKSSESEAGSVEFNPDRSLVRPINVPFNTFNSPASMVSTIGHEMIHQIQIRRIYAPINMMGLDSVVKNMWELEAHSWELDSTTFAWGIGDYQAQLLPCLPAGERDFIESERDRYEAGLRKAIIDIRTGIRASSFTPSLEKWLNKDDWAKGAWLKDLRNQNWKSWK